MNILIYSVIHGTYTPCTYATRYHVPSRKVFQGTKTLESIQEQRYTHSVEFYNKQQIFIWVINHLKLPSFQGHGYNEWDICEECERRILIKSSYYEIIENLGYQSPLYAAP